jgi:predicted ribosome quality control (RQC) complex YloA/Tae2 family protein
VALDGALLSFITAEINTRLESARIDKIQQPEKDEIDITFRLRGGNEKLLLSASSNNPRAHFTQIVKENPMTAPMFCMLLRKHLSSARFAGATQPGLERILFLNFDCYNEFGDEVKRTLVIEIMGRHSNIMLLDEHSRIMDAVKHIDDTMSSKRQVLPGLLYEMPPKQDKTDVTDILPEEVLAKLRGQKGELGKALIGVLQGVSPVVCRELAQLACRDAAAHVEAMTAEGEERLCYFLKKLSSDLKAAQGVPVLISQAKSGRPLDFSFMDITQYGTAASVRRYDGFSQLLDAFYSERDRVERVTRRAHDMLNVITNAVERISHKLDNQRNELKACVGRDRLKICGDLISSNIFKLERGMSRCELENYYENGSPLVAISLDPQLTPARNAQKYYRDYHKAATGEKVLREQISLGEKELAYLETVFDELSRATGESELAEIRDELTGEGYLKKHAKRTDKRIHENAPLKFRSTDGFEIRVGRNNRQNDKLTLKMADKRDLWLHTRNIPGAHVIIQADGMPVPDSTLSQAAMLAALHSHAKDSAQVPVDYTFVKNVKKPSGAKPGMVIYDDFKTAFVRPDTELAAKLKI